MPTIDPATAPPRVRDLLERARSDVDAELARRLAIPQALAAGDPERRLREAMAYAVLGGGKRLRPAVVLASAAAVGDRASALPAAAAIELLHAYTLVHDDLPAMDDDSLRRGRPTVHIEFGEAIAILAGDGLQAAAFECLTDLGGRAGPAVAALSAASGPAALLGGQARDLAVTDSAGELDFAAVEAIHRGKTGALFSAAAELGAIAAGADGELCASLRDFGMAIGIAFQHADDRDDGELAHFAERARRRRIELARVASESIVGLGDSGSLLVEIARWIGGSGSR